MELSQRTIGRLKEFVTGDNRLTPYRSGPMLVRLFNEYGFDDVYPMGGGFPSRHVFAEEKLRALNGKPELIQVIEAVFDPLEFETTDMSVADAIAAINPYLERDGARLVSEGTRTKLRGARDEVVEFAPPSDVFDPDTLEFVQENADKARRKLRDEDYRGAITNARSMVEDVLIGVEMRLSDAPPKYDGDLPKLFKRVRKLLKMEAETYKADADLFTALNGLTGVIDGLAGFSNRASDRHAGKIKPARHHAHLIVNSASSLCAFVVESAQLQLAKGEPKSRG